MSTARTPNPPPFVIMSTLFDSGRGRSDKDLVQSMASLSVGALMAPACLNAASKILSFPARDAVCDAMAFAPALDLPDFSMIIGLDLLTFRTVLMNSLP